MKAFTLALVLAVVPLHLDLPPEGVYEAATATATAERGAAVQVTETAPPPPTPMLFTSASSSGRCVGAEPLLAALSPGWSVERMSRIMYRESRCQPGARNGSSSATGLLQILASHCRWLEGQLGEWCTRDRLTDPGYNVRAAAVLWLEQSYGAWSTS